MRIESMLPFLEKNEIDRLIDDVLEEKVDLKLYQVLPFATEDKIDAVIQRAFDDDSITVELKHLLPFLNDKQMDVMYDAYKNQLIHHCCVDPDEMIPYLSKAKIKEIFEEQMQKMKLEIKDNVKKAFDEISHEHKK